MALLALPGPAFSRLDPFSAQGVPLCGGATQIRLVRAEKVRQREKGRRERKRTEERIVS